MFENEDVILPDDFQEAQPQAEEIQEVVEETHEDSFESMEELPEFVEDTTPTEEVSEPVLEQPQKFKIKYNKEEQEIDYEEAVPLIQKGMNYDKALERAKQESRDAVIAEQGYEWNGKPITTEAEYKQALQEKELMDKYQNQNLPDDVIQELIENRKFRNQYESDKQAKSEEEKQNVEFNDFFSYFKQANGRDFIAGKDEIPQQVWDAQANGVPLKYAYMEHQNNELKQQMQVLKQNKENEMKAPIGSVTSHGSTEVASEDDFLKGFNSI
ncbi:hypothetical protein AB3Z07_05075 [Metabacillus halosaccharovorans]|uniref:hypothetical protein n=1 Tax=Metabacillus halosaccharovorans TaxID=930124 RepID=UPI0034CF4E6D